MDAGGYRRVVAEADPSVGVAPLLDFTSGYVLRSLDQFPRQGSEERWKVRQNYLFDVGTTAAGSKTGRCASPADRQDRPPARVAA